MVLRLLRKRWYLIPIVLLVLLILPFSVAAQTNQDILQILNAAINGVIFAARDAYCASGVGALCPVALVPAA